MSLAFFNYESAYGHLPPAAVCGPDGQPLLSWRVLILSFIEGEDLYKQFHLDEPWDSEHNHQFIDRMPKTYAAPWTKYVDVPPGHTLLKVFVGPGTPFEPGVKLKFTPDDFPDGRDETLLFVEAGDPVPWSKPDDIPFDRDRPLKLRGLFRDGYRAISAGGSPYLFIRYDCDEAALRAAVTRNGREDVPAPWAR
ncbi:MAG: DUF1559 domain-containing protein [Gemmataceae bacterium]